MESKINNGGSAFPVIPLTEICGDRTFNASGYPYPEAGMSLRDWFAGQDLAGVIAVCPSDQGAVDALRETGSAVSYFAKCAYEIADAMLKARGD